MSINVSERAAQQIKKQLSKRGKGLGLRLAIKKAGCSGFAYVIDYADEIAENDRVFESHAVKIIIHADHLAVLDGIELDYTREGINEAFRFHNPNAKEYCGCGESFAV